MRYTSARDKDGPVYSHTGKVMEMTKLAVPSGWFTQEALQVFAKAEEHADSFDHNYVGTEHLILGLLSVENGGAFRLLHPHVDLASMRMAVEFINGRDEGRLMGEIDLTPRSKWAIDLAQAACKELGHSEVGTEHLLLGILREGRGIGIGILESLSIRYDSESLVRSLKEGTKDASQVNRSD